MSRDVEVFGEAAGEPMFRVPSQKQTGSFEVLIPDLCPTPGRVEFALEAPDGEVLTPASASTLTSLHFVQVGRLAYYRMSLPAIPAHATGSHVGQWNAVLSIATVVPRYVAPTGDYVVSSQQTGRVLPYDLIVHCYSNLAFKAYAQQSGLAPGRERGPVATLREYDVPVDHRAVVWADITRPDGSQFTVKLAETDPGRFATSLSGLYAMRVRAMGSMFRGVAFQREQTLSAAVYPGGDDPPKPGDNGAFWCRLLHCLVSDKVIDPKLIERLCESGVDLEGLLRCLAAACASKGPAR
jgi:hypothetical protein